MKITLKKVSFYPAKGRNEKYVGIKLMRTLPPVCLNGIYNKDIKTVETAILTV